MPPHLIIMCCFTACEILAFDNYIDSKARRQAKLMHMH